MKFNDNRKKLIDLVVGDNIYIWYIKDKKRCNEYKIISKNKKDDYIFFEINQGKNGNTPTVKIHKDSLEYMFKNIDLIISSEKPR